MVLLQIGQLRMRNRLPLGNQVTYFTANFYSSTSLNNKDSNDFRSFLVKPFENMKKAKVIISRKYTENLATSFRCLWTYSPRNLRLLVKSNKEITEIFKLTQVFTL